MSRRTSSTSTRAVARHGLGVGLALGLGITGLGWPLYPMAAHASAQGCTFAPNGYMCIKVFGRGLYVNSVQVNRSKVLPATSALNGVCDYHALVTIRASGREWDYTGGPKNRHQGCTPGGGYINVSIGLSFPNGARVCGYFFEGEAKQGGPACETIHGSGSPDAPPPSVSSGPPSGPGGQVGTPGGAVLKVGSTGEAVARVQRALRIPDDGIFGKQTRDAVLTFQQDSHLRYRDGKVGPETAAALFE